MQVVYTGEQAHAGSGSSHLRPFQARRHAVRDLSGAISPSSREVWCGSGILCGRFSPFLERLAPRELSGGTLPAVQEWLHFQAASLRASRSGLSED